MRTGGRCSLASGILFIGVFYACGYDGFLPALPVAMAEAPAVPLPDHEDATTRHLVRVAGWSVMLLGFVIGLLLLYSGIRAFLRRSIFGGLIWTVLGLVVLSWLIH